VCNRPLPFWEFAQNGEMPAVYLERAREQARLRTRHPLTLYGPGPEADWNPDWRRAGLRNPGRTSPILRRSVIAVNQVGGGGLAG
jgi:hypothetical protein